MVTRNMFWNSLVRAGVCCIVCTKVVLMFWPRARTSVKVGGAVRLNGMRMRSLNGLMIALAAWTTFADMAVLKGVAIIISERPIGFM